MLNNVLLLNYKNIIKNYSHIRYQFKSKILIWINFKFQKTTVNKFME